MTTLVLVLGLGFTVLLLASTCALTVDCNAAITVHPNTCRPTHIDLQYRSTLPALTMGYTREELLHLNSKMCRYISYDLLQTIKDLNILKGQRRSRGGTRRYLYNKGRNQQIFDRSISPKNGRSHQQNRSTKSPHSVNHNNLVIVKDYVPDNKNPSTKDTLVARNNSSEKTAIHFGFINPRSVRNKTAVIMDEIISQDIDCCCMAETWLNSMDDVKRSDLKCDGYNFCDVIRSGVGGGTGIIFKDTMHCELLDSGEMLSIEFSEWLLRYNSVELRILIIYRRPYSPAHPVTTCTFLKEIQDFLAKKVIGRGKLLITGDINIHLDDPADRDAIKFTNIISSMDLEQHVHLPTHEHGHTLDVFITRSNGELSMDKPQQGLKISDHYLITSKCAVPKPSWETKLVTYRKLKNIDIDALKSDLSTLCYDLSDSTNLPVLWDSFESGLSMILDKHAPLIEKKIVVRPKVPWFDDNLRASRRKRRQAERRYRRTKSDTHRIAYASARTRYANLLKATKSSFYYNAITEAHGDQKKLFNIVQSLTNRSKGTLWPDHENKDKLAQDFGVFFDDKVCKLRHSLAATETPAVAIDKTCDFEFLKFKEVTQDEVRKLVSASATKHCELDSFPTMLLKQTLDEVVPVLERIINLSLENGLFIQSWKEAIVKPLLKKAGMKLELKSYRPVSNLKYISKLVEKAAFNQINSYADNNGLTPKVQSAYRAHHSTETTLLKVYSDLIDCMDNGKVVFLVLIDQSAAFDLVDHQLLIERLHKEYGMSGTVLEWCKTYLCDRRQRISVDGHLSEHFHLESGVPQGSVGGPCLFTRFSASLIQCIQQWLVNTHCYADDSQLYLAFQPGNSSSELHAKTTMEGCIEDVRRWMAENRLFMNDSKTEFMIIGTPQQLAKLTVDGLMIGNDFVRCVNHVRNLGAFFDQHLSMKRHIEEKCKQAYRQLYKLQNIRGLLNPAATKTLIHAFVTSQLDYSNSLLINLSKCDLDKLQSVQNSAIRLLYKKRKHDHVTHLLIEAHWLPVSHRVIFKILLFVFKCIHGIAPVYLQDMIKFVSSARYGLRSVANRKLVVPRCKTKFGERSFRIAGPSHWNNLPADIREINNLEAFKKRIKTYLFTSAYKL
jgi:hypothetical protein